MLSPRKLFFLIIFLFAIALYFALPSEPLNLENFSIPIEKQLVKRPIDLNIFGRRIYYNPQVKLGLDLQGGTQLILNANMEEIDSADRTDALESAKEIISRRVDAFGVTEPLIQTSVNEEAEQYRLIVELPGVQDVAQAVSLIGKTAQLEFREENPDFDFQTATASGVTLDDVYLKTNLSGDQLKKASVQFDPQTAEPVVAIAFTSEGTDLFAEITERNINKPVAIIVDGQVVTAPIVNTAITQGEAVIQGQFTTESARNLAIQLNAGALPVPIEIISQRNIGASLGQDSVQKSLVAGIIGLALVMGFMVLYYGYLGFLADLALLIYAVLTLALYKILGITLTLPGLAGFILSVGMAVDSNILIFERYKEETRMGRAWSMAMELGFGRAWDSIKDANVATLLICFILFNPFNWQFLNSSGLVRGFSLTLALGILISLFTGVVVTRTLIRLFYVGKNQVQAK